MKWRVQFKCPECGSTSGLVEVVSILGLYPIQKVYVKDKESLANGDFTEVSFGERIIDDSYSDLQGYSCLSCGEFFPISCLTDAVRWLYRHGMLELEKDSAEEENHA